jgi:hypothetical protein
VTKNQLYDSLGKPHLQEGFSEVREWDYVFSFRTGANNEAPICQYKVILDRAPREQSFHWAPQARADHLGWLRIGNPCQPSARGHRFGLTSAVGEANSPPTPKDMQ